MLILEVDLQTRRIPSRFGGLWCISQIYTYTLKSRRILADFFRTVLFWPCSGILFSQRVSVSEGNPSGQMHEGTWPLLIPSGQMTHSNIASLLHVQPSPRSISGERNLAALCNRNLFELWRFDHSAMPLFFVLFSQNIVGIRGIHLGRSTERRGLF